MVILYTCTIYSVIAKYEPDLFNVETHQKLYKVCELKTKLWRKIKNKMANIIPLLLRQLNVEIGPVLRP